jgi:beta-glucanase (GH16 family)
MRKIFRKVMAFSLVAAMAIQPIWLPVGNSNTVTKADDFYSGWKINWSDEFDGNSLNRNVWNVEVNGYGGWNNEHQYYKDGDDTIQVNDGSLKIIGRKQSVWGTDAEGVYKEYNYTSARINTQNKVKLGNGRIEARIKLPIFRGTFPAFWLMGNNGKTWPECGEIDIMEAINTENIAYGTAHWPKNVGTGSSAVNSEGNGTYGWNLNLSQWHVYGVERSDTAIKWYVDGRVYHTVDLTKDAVNQEPLKLDAYILLNLAIGGEWPGHVIDDTAFPATMEVDYVRHYVKDNSVPETEQTTEEGTTVIDGTELLQNTAFAGNASWTESSANQASFSNGGNGSVTVNVPAYNSGNAWDTQIVQSPISLDSSKYYVATYTVTSSADKTLMFLIQKSDYSAEDATVITNVKAGETKLVKTVFKASESRDYLYGIMLGYINGVASPATNVKISNVSLKVYNTQSAANAAVNSIPEPTTEAPTQATKYTVTLDGAVVATVDKGMTYIFPTSANVGYYGDGKLYKAGSTYTVNKNVSFSSVNIRMSKEPNLRYVRPAGLRFSGKIVCEDEGVFSSGAIVESGLLIAPNDYLSNGSELSMSSGVKCTKIKTNIWVNNIPGSFATSFDGIISKNYERDFVSRGYMIVEYADGTRTAVYSAVSTPTSVSELAFNVFKNKTIYNSLNDTNKQIVLEYMG